MPATPATVSSARRPRARSENGTYRIVFIEPGTESRQFAVFIRGRGNRQGVVGTAFAKDIGSRSPDGRDRFRLRRRFSVVVSAAVSST